MEVTVIVICNWANRANKPNKPNRPNRPNRPNKSNKPNKQFLPSHPFSSPRGGREGATSEVGRGLPLRSGGGCSSHFLVFPLAGALDISPEYPLVEHVVRAGMVLAVGLAHVLGIVRREAVGQ